MRLKSYKWMVTDTNYRMARDIVIAHVGMAYVVMAYIVVAYVVILQMDG